MLSLGTEQASGRRKNRMMKYSGYVHQRQPLCASAAEFLKRDLSLRCDIACYEDQQ